MQARTWLSMSTSSRLGSRSCKNVQFSASFELYEGAEGELTKISRSFPLQFRGSASFLDEVLR